MTKDITPKQETPKNNKSGLIKDNQAKDGLTNKQEEWEKEFYFRLSNCTWLETHVDNDEPDVANEIKAKYREELKSFIRKLIQQAREELIEEIEDQIKMTIELNEKWALEGKIVDWPSVLRAFVKYYLHSLQSKQEEKD